MVGAEWIGVYLRDWGRLGRRAAHRLTSLGASVLGGGGQGPSIVETSENGRLRAARAAVHVLGEFRGCAIVLLSAEAWTKDICLRLIAQRSGLTDEWDESYRSSFERWEQRVAHRGSEAAGPPPIEPGAALSELPLAVSDDIGTPYRPTAWSAGGSESRWATEWHFEPGLPVTARRLTVSLGSERHRRYDIHLTREELLSSA
jgi:hypothetical protein